MKLGQQVDDHSAFDPGAAEAQAPEPIKGAQELPR
jgi:hypothetical protein